MLFRSQSIRLLIGQAKREGSPSPFRRDGLPADVSRCLEELRSIDQGIDLSDLSHHMIGRLFSAIQDLLAKKQFSRSFEKRLMAQFNLARFHTEQRSSMNVPGSKAIARLLCKTSPPRRLTTLRSKSEELQFPNGIRPANTQTLLLLLEALGAGAVEAAKGWVESQDSGTVSVGNEALQLFLAREGTGGIDIILSQYDSLALIL